MIEAIEAVCINGAIKPLEPVVFEEEERLVILRLPKRASPAASRGIRGSMMGMLSSVDEFIATKSPDFDFFARRATRSLCF